MYVTGRTLDGPGPAGPEQTAWPKEASHVPSPRRHHAGPRARARRAPPAPRDPLPLVRPAPLHRRPGLRPAAVHRRPDARRGSRPGRPHGGRELALPLLGSRVSPARAASRSRRGLTRVVTGSGGPESVTSVA